MNIAVCIVNYNSYTDTIECIKSLLVQDYSNFSIIIVDNASTNDSLNALKRYLAEHSIDFYCRQNYDDSTDGNNDTKVWIIAAEENRGFSAGNNIAIRFVREHLLHTTHILILNNDTVVDPYFLSTIIKDYKQQCEVTRHSVAMGAEERNYYSHNIIHCGDNYLNLLSGINFSRPIIPYFRYISGACLMVDVHAPLMCEDYFLYYDDVEYCFILRQQGYKLCRARRAYYFHKVSATTSHSHSVKEHTFISMWRFFMWHYPVYIPFVFIVRFIEHIVLHKKGCNYVMLSTLKSCLANKLFRKKYKL